MKNLNPSRMRYKAHFGKMGPTEKRNPNTGRPIQGFVEEFAVWAGVYSLSLSEQLAYHGTDEKVSLVIFVRHNSKVTENYHVQFKDEMYTVTSVQQDDGLVPIGYDLVTLKKVTSNA